MTYYQVGCGCSQKLGLDSITTAMDKARMLLNAVFLNDDWKRLTNSGMPNLMKLVIIRMAETDHVISEWYE